MNVTLTPELERKVRELVDAGVYADSDELISDALRQLHDRRWTQREENLRAAWLASARAKSERAELPASKVKVKTVS